MFVNSRSKASAKHVTGLITVIKIRPFNIRESLQHVIISVTSNGFFHDFR